MHDTQPPFLRNCLLFTQMLRRAGVPIGLDEVLSFTQALELIELGERAQVYHAARALLVHSHAHLRLFDVIFNRFWRRSFDANGQPRQTMPRAPRHKLHAAPFTMATYMAYKARLGDPEVDIADKAGTGSALEALQRKAFSEMSAEELAQIKLLIQRLRWRIGERVTRRREQHPRGSAPHMRAILRDAARHGGVPLRLVRQRRKVKPRPLVLLADISGSMEKYARLLLQFFYSVTQSVGQVECFVFGTRLTRITPQLRIRNIDRAVDEAAREVLDWAGGTRIGASLHTFNRQWARRVLARGAVVLVVSDGCEQGDPALLARELRFVQHRCHRLIWLNPLLGHAAYRPLAGGMQAALRHVDDFLPIRSFQSLTDLAAHLGALDDRRRDGRAKDRGDRG